MLGLLLTLELVALLVVVVVAMAAAGALVAEESEDLGYCGASLPVTKVGPLLLRPLVAGASILPVLLVVSSEALARPMVVTAAGLQVLEKVQAGSGCGIPVVPMLESALPRKRLSPLSGPSWG